MKAHVFPATPELMLLLGFVLVGIAGCKPPPPPSPAISKQAGPAQLRLLVVDDQPLAETIKRHWLAHTESELQVTNVTEEQAAAAQHLPADVVIYRPAMLGQFAMADWLLPIEESFLADPEYARGEVLGAQLATECRWGRRIMALPLGSPQLVLLYRADLIGKEPLPNTWEEYADLIAKFKEPPSGVTGADWLPTAEPLADGWAGRLLLARAAAGAQHRDQLSSLWNLSEMEPLIAGSPWVRALEQLQAAQSAAKDRPLLTAQGCFAKFMAGQCAVAITWPQDVPEQSSVQLKSEQIGLWPLPGSAEAFNPETATWEPVRDGGSLLVPTLGLSGRIGSVTRASAQPREAQRLLLWASGPGLSGRVASMSSQTTVFRNSHFREGRNWDAPPFLQPLLPAYGKLLGPAEGQWRQLIAPRIPGQRDYLATLDEAVLSAVQEKQSPTEALKRAAEKWRDITEQHGRSKQQRALKLSLGLSD